MRRVSVLTPVVILMLLTVAVTMGFQVAEGTPILIGAGDIATCYNNNDEATAKLLDGNPGTVFTAGDNAYDSGTDAEFANCYDPTWGRHKASTNPTPGNHEYLTAGASGYFNYFGAAAGDPSKGYYSYNLGEWHIVALNSNCENVGGCGEASPQIQWLKADLASNPNTCIAAYFHHPLFSSGHHGNQTKVKPIWEALYAAKADVVISGHDHNYERFAPQDPNGIADPARGIREFVVGTGGVSLRTFGTVKPNSEVRDSVTHGVLKLTLHQSSYDWQFIPVAGKTFSDSGSGRCDGALDSTPPAAPTGLSANASQGSIALDWANNTDTDLAGYSVYRSTLSGGPYSKITSSLLTTSAYTDSKVKEGTTYHYVVSATDTSTNESSYSNEASATAPIVALSFDGVDDWVSVPSTKLLNQSATTERTYEGLLKTGSDVSRRQFVYEEGGDGNGFSLEISGGRVRFNAWSTTNGWSTVSASGAVNANTLYHVAGVYHQPSGEVRLYLDGALKGSASGAGSMPSHGDGIAMGGVSGSTRDHSHARVLSGNRFEGFIGEFAAWNHARSGAQVSSDAQSGLVGSEAGLIALYKIDEGSGTVLNDSTANKLHATINGASWVTENTAPPPEPTVALSFDGVDDWVSVPSTKLLNQSATTERTYEGLLKTGSDVSRRQFVYEEGGDGNGFSLEISGGRVRFNAWSTTNGWSTVSASGAVNANTLYHVAGVYHQPSGEVRLYLDGALKGSASGAGSMPSHGDGIAIGAVSGSTRDHSHARVLSGGNFGGTLSEFAAWNHARTAAQVSSDAQSALGGTEAGLIALYKIDEGSGSVLNDSTANKLHATINGASWVTQT